MKKLTILALLPAIWLGCSIAQAEVVSGETAALAPSKPAVAKAKPAPKRLLVRPRPAPLDPRLVVFPYTRDYIYPIPAKLDDYTHIELAENERVIALTLPDKLRWFFKVLATKRDILVKPVVPDEKSTAATIITNLRRYELSLSVVDEDGEVCRASTRKDECVWYQRVSWELEDGTFEATDIQQPRFAGMDGLSRTHSPGALGGLSASADNPTGPSAGGCGQEQVQVDRLNFNYSIVGDAPFKPTMVFDDGRFTWFKFPKVQDMPPLFAINPTTGDAEIEHFLPCKGHFVVQALLPGGALLKLGKAEVRVVNKNTQDCGGFFGSSCKPVGNILDR